MAVPSPRARDLVAGLTVWAVPVPEALAYASIAGCHRVGLDAAPGALIVNAAIVAVLCLVIAFSA